MIVLLVLCAGVKEVDTYGRESDSKSLWIFLRVEEGPITTPRPIFSPGHLEVTPVKLW